MNLDSSAVNVALVIRSCCHLFEAQISNGQEVLAGEDVVNDTGNIQGDEAHAVPKSSVDGWRKTLIVR